MVKKKEASSQAKGRAAKSIRDSDAAADRMIAALEMNKFRGGDGAKGIKPAAYGNEKTQKKQKPIDRMKSKMYGAGKDPKWAMARNRSAKAKDSGRKN